MTPTRRTHVNTTRTVKANTLAPKRIRDRLDREASEAALRSWERCADWYRTTATQSPRP